MKEVIEFITLSDPNARTVLFGAVILGIYSSAIGCFTLLRKRALVGDAVAHSVLPGICLAFIIQDKKDPFILLLGAFISGWIALFTIDYLRNRSKLKMDAALGSVLAFFYAVGIIMLTFIQNSGTGAQAGLNRFLFGRLAGLTTDDVILFAIVGVIVLFLIFLFFKEFKLVAFNRDFALSIGLPVKFIEFVLAFLAVLVISTGIKAVGIILMSALLISPAVSARFITDDLKKMVWISAIFGTIAAIGGAFVSYSGTNRPTGPWIVIFLFVIAFLTFLLSPKKGLISKMLMRSKIKNKVLTENLLKALYHLGESNKDFLKERSFDEISARRKFTPWELNKGIKLLARNNFLIRLRNNAIILTEPGLIEGKKIVRYHRLWEMYLSTKMNLPPDHVHPGAESMEHVITPEIEKLILEELGYPSKDPHDKDIPEI